MIKDKKLVNQTFSLIGQFFYLSCISGFCLVWVDFLKTWAKGGDKIKIRKVWYQAPLGNGSPKLIKPSMSLSVKMNLEISLILGPIPANLLDFFGLCKINMIKLDIRKDVGFKNPLPSKAGNGKYMVFI